jgi:glutaryl-CoA dehydrogenase
VKYLNYRRICSKAEFPKQILKGLADIGGFGPYIPEEYGGAGLDQISYGLIMQEIERGDSGYVLLLRFNRL